MARHVRISPYKVRQVLSLIKGKDVDEAQTILRLTPRRSSEIVVKVLKSAVANAENNLGLDASDLYVSRAYADEGVTLKRIRPRARGMADRIRRRTSHINIVVAEKEG